MRQSNALLALVCIVLLAALGACTGKRALPSAAVDVTSDAGGAPTGGAAPDSCAVPNEGCECDSEGELVECGKVVRSVSDDYLSCSVGRRQCIGGLWRECQGDRVVEVLRQSVTMRHLAALPSATPCVGNPCDPHCQAFEDEPTELLGDGGLFIAGDGGLALKPTPPRSGTSAVACDSIEVVPATQQFVVTSLGGASATSATPQPGLNGEYFASQNASGIPTGATSTLTRVDSRVEFDWGSGSAHASLPADRFSARWTGYVVPPATGSYTFYVTADDGVRLWVGGTQLVDAWVDQGPTEYQSSTVSLTAGVQYPIRMEYYENGGGATAYLRWQGPTIAKQVIDSAYLRTQQTTSCSATVIEAESMTHTTGGSATDGWNLWSNGSMYQNASFGSGSQSLTVRARSDWAGNEWAHMVVSIGGTSVYSTYVDSTSWKDFTFTYNGSGASQELRIAFDNDYYSNGADRNLYVDKTTIGCTAQSSSVSVGYSGGIVVEPATAKFTVEARPDGCFAGEVAAAWDLDQLGNATIGQDGSMQIVAPVAGAIGVKAYAGSFVAEGSANVRVNARESVGVNASTVAAFDGPANGNDPMRVLYPYADTLFPLGLRPPVIQWDTNGQPASAIKIGLRWPVGGDPDFLWERIVVEPTPARFTIPAEVWKAFEQTAKGDDAAYVLQRIVGGQLKEEVIRPLRFAHAPLRGKIIYSEYGRSDWHAYIMGLNPGGTASAYNMFSNTSGASGCPVCHSVSANGEMFVTSDATWSNTPGVSEIQADGTLKYLADMPNSSTYTQNRDDWRGLGWAPLTPDGTYALAANNVYGNTRQSVVGINTSTRAVSVPTTLVSGGNGIGLKAEYYPNNSLSGTPRLRTDPFINFNWGTGSPGGLLGTDNFSIRWSGRIQPYFSETYTVYVTSSDGVLLTINGVKLIDQLSYNGTSVTRSATFAAQAGVRYDIELRYVEKTGSAAVKLEWESALTPREVVPQTQLTWDTSGHGALVSYYSDTSLSSLAATRVEPQIAANWGSYGPKSGMPVDSFSSRWNAELEAPVTGSYQFCASADDRISVKIGTTSVLSTTSATTNTCGSAISLVAGQRYPLQVEHIELTGSANLSLEWTATLATTTVLAREVIPSERLFLPSSYASPANGLTATYYDNSDFNRSLASNPTSNRAFSRVESQINLDWGTAGNYRPEYYRLQDNTYFAGRFTGQIEASCTGVTQFRTTIDDAASLWVNGVRLTTKSTSGSADGSIFLQAGNRYDIKLDWWQNTGGANVYLYWKPCGASAWAIVPNSNLFPTGDFDTDGFVRSGGDNGSGVDYFVWRTTRSSGVAPTDVTASSAGKWGLQGTTMMVPSFAPDASRLVFVDGDQAVGSGWRKGLSIFEFDQTAKVFKNRRLVVNNWPSGDVIKWPTFESDSRSVIYSSSPPGSFCCVNTYWTRYGYMAPSDYYETPGRLMSVNTAAAAPSPVLLARATAGERAVDANKAWQPTMLPTSAGGYRWVVFTSSRPYGNTVNTTGQNDYSNPSSYSPMLNTSDVQSQLWVAAIDDEESGGSDRSYPAFWLPNQNYNEDASKGYVNERGFWALDACRPVGTGSGSVCEVNEDCCGGALATPTAVCKVDTPVTLPLTRHCAVRTTADSCSLTGGSCSTTDECCPGTVCVDSACRAPPQFDEYQFANIERIYHATCDFDALPVWRFFDWKAATPPTNSAIEFYAQSEADPSQFLTLPVAPDPVNDSRIVYLGSAFGDNVDVWVGNDVGALLNAAGLVQYEYVKITMRFVPNDQLTGGPLLRDVRFSFSCPPMQ